MSYSVGHRHGLNPVLLWLWHRLAATFPIGPPAWKLPYAMGEALKRQKKKNILVFKFSDGNQEALAMAIRENIFVAVGRKQK